MRVVPSIDPMECFGCAYLLYTAHGFMCNRRPAPCEKNRQVTVTWVHSTTMTAPLGSSTTRKNEWSSR